MVIQNNAARTNKKKLSTLEKVIFSLLMMLSLSSTYYFFNLFNEKDSDTSLYLLISSGFTLTCVTFALISRVCSEETIRAAGEDHIIRTDGKE
jgi:hypothetical protein